MDYLKLKSIIEGLLFLAGEEGLSTKQIADIVEQQQELVEQCLEDMKQDMEQGEEACNLSVLPVIISLQLYPNMHLTLKSSHTLRHVRHCLKLLWRRWPLWPTASPLQELKSKRFGG